MLKVRTTLESLRDFVDTYQGEKIICRELYVFKAPGKDFSATTFVIQLFQAEGRSYAERAKEAMASLRSSLLECFGDNNVILEYSVTEPIERHVE